MVSRATSKRKHAFRIHRIESSKIRWCKTHAPHQIKFNCKQFAINTNFAFVANHKIPMHLFRFARQTVDTCFSKRNTKYTPMPVCAHFCFCPIEVTFICFYFHAIAFASDFISFSYHFLLFSLYAHCAAVRRRRHKILAIKSD